LAQGRTDHHDQADRFLAATAQPINLIGTADDKLLGLGTILTMKN